jgi:hypothetical protein
MPHAANRFGLGKLTLAAHHIFVLQFDVGNITPAGVKAPVCIFLPPFDPARFAFAGENTVFKINGSHFAFRRIADQALHGNPQLMAVFLRKKVHEGCVFKSCSNITKTLFKGSIGPQNLPAQIGNNHHIMRKIDKFKKVRLRRGGINRLA